MDKIWRNLFHKI